MEKIFCFIKFTKKEFADRLIKNGQVHFNLPVFFNKLNEKERGDENEGASWIDNSQIVNIKAEHPTLGTFEFKPLPNLPSKTTQYNYYFLSFSLYAITTNMFDKDNTHQIDSRMIKFGDTAVIIEKPQVFLNSLMEKLKNNKIRYEMKPVIYSDLTIGRNDLTPFHKKLEHKHQFEFRIIIENTDNIAKSIDIGSIEGYCKPVNSQLIIESLWEAKRNKV